MGRPCANWTIVSYWPQHFRCESPWPPARVCTAKVMPMDSVERLAQDIEARMDEETDIYIADLKRREELTTHEELLARTAFKTGMMRTFVVINRVVGFIHARSNY